MTGVLRGNFKTKNTVSIKDLDEETLEERFEKEALSKLGGSIAFVSRKKVLLPEDENSGK